MCCLFAVYVLVFCCSMCSSVVHCLAAVHCVYLLSTACLLPFNCYSLCVAAVYCLHVAVHRLSTVQLLSTACPACCPLSTGSCQLPCCPLRCRCCFPLSSCCLLYGCSCPLCCCYLLSGCSCPLLSPAAHCVQLLPTV
jgi:hypothetical protein